MTQWSELRLHDGGPCPVGEMEVVEAVFIHGNRITVTPISEARDLNWNAMIAFRVALPEPRDMQVPWNVLPKEYNRATKGKSERAFVHRNPIQKDEHFGMWLSDDMIRIDQLVGYDPGTKPWDQSLIQRPKGS